jgi:hypothetical protein
MANVERSNGGENGRAWRAAALGGALLALLGCGGRALHGADDKPGGLWIAGSSHKVCSREQVTCPLGPNDCPSAFPRCVLPDGRPAYLPDGGAVTAQGPADAAPAIPVCVK